MRIPMESPPEYTAEELELSQDPVLRAKLERFIKANFKHFSIGDMAHALGVSPKVIFELVPWIKKDAVQFKTQMVVVLREPKEAAQDSDLFEQGLI